MWWIWSRTVSSVLEREWERRRISKLDRQRNQDSSIEHEKVSPPGRSSLERSRHPPNLLHKPLVDNQSSNRIDRPRRRSNRETRRDRWIPSNDLGRLHSSVRSLVQLPPPPSRQRNCLNRPLPYRRFLLNVPPFLNPKLPTVRLARINRPSWLNGMRLDSSRRRSGGISRDDFPFCIMDILWLSLHPVQRTLSLAAVYIFVFVPNPHSFHPESSPNNILLE